MKTTVQLPNAVFQQAKAVASRRRMTLEELVLRGVKREISAEAGENPSADALIAALSVGRNTQPVGRLDRDSLHDRPILR